MLKRIYRLSVMGLLVYICYHALLSTWLISNFGHDWVFKSLKDVLVVGFGIFSCIIAYKSRQRLNMRPFDQWLLFLLINFCVLVLVMSALDFHPKASLAGILISLRFFVFFGICWLAARLGFLKLNDFMLKRLLLFTTIPVTVFGLMQMFLLDKNFLKHFGYSASTIPPYQTVDSNESLIRVSSSLRGANPLGAFLVIWSSLTAAASLFYKNYRQPVVIMAGIVLLAYGTYSRSAVIGIAAAYLVLLAIRLKDIDKRYLYGLASVGILFVVGLGLFRNSVLLQRLVFHNDPQEASSLNSDDLHFSSVTQAVDRIYHKPGGHGAGSAGLASTYGDKPLVIENYFLETGYQYGVFGLTLVVCIHWLAAVGLLKAFREGGDKIAAGLLAALIGLCAVGLLLPVWTDETVAYAFWGLTGLSLGAYNVANGKRARPTHRKIT